MTATTKALASLTALKRECVIAVMVSLEISAIPVKKTITTLPMDVYVSITPIFQVYGYVPL